MDKKEELLEKFKRYLFESKKGYNYGLLDFFNENNIKILGFDFVDVKVNANQEHRYASFHSKSDEFNETFKEYISKYPSWLSFSEPLEFIETFKYECSGNKKSRKTNQENVEKWNEYILGLDFEYGYIEKNKIKSDSNKNIFNQSKEYWSKNINKLYPDLTTFIYTKADVDQTDFQCIFFIYLSDCSGELNNSADKLNFIIKSLKTFQYGHIGTYVLPQQLDKVKSTSLKSALAAVMARNMSHNIGSHVLNKMSSSSAIKEFFELNGVDRYVIAKNRKDDDIVGDFFPDLDEFSTKKDKSDNTKSSSELNKKLKELNDPNFLKNYKFSTNIYTLSPFFVDVNKNTTKEELARVFNDYLKKRMDFVADVATSNKTLLNTSKYLFSDIFRGFERNLLLLQNISGKENQFHYQFQFQYKDGENTYDYYEYENGKLKLDENNITNKNNKFIDPIVAVPNDILGNQAFYIILENIIRNTAKHTGAPNVTFTIRVEDLKEDDFYRITIFDNATFSGVDDDEKKEKLKNLITKRNISIAQPVLNENNEIRNSGWGTIEIKLAACYLSGLNMLKMDYKMYAPIGYEIYEQNFEAENDKNAIKAYTDFLSSDNQETFNLKKLNDDSEYKISDCSNSLKRKVSFNNKTFTRYPIVQAVNANVNDKTKGFGYSFLMKKPKKLLIIDPNEKIIKTNSEEDKANNSINLITLKRLGIDIIKNPSENSIYNHPYMIIVGNKNEENYYNDWFNLPQERCFYNNNDHSYKYYEYNLNEDKYQLFHDSKICVNSEYILVKRLNKTLERKLDYLALWEFRECYYNYLVKKGIAKYKPQIIIKNQNNDIELPDFLLAGNHKLNELTDATFNHHGMSEKAFKNAKYTEIYGSVSPIGLYYQNIKNRFVNSNVEIVKLKISIKKEVQDFFIRGCNTTIMVIDERIQSALNEIGCSVEAKENDAQESELPNGDDSYTLANKQIFEKSHVLVPSKDNSGTDLNASDLKKYQTQLFNYISENSKSIQFLVIHFGILEGLRDSGVEVINVLKKIKKAVNSKHCKIVITSGRGYTPDIKDLNQYFVSYSTINSLLLDPHQRSKSHLVECLSQLRKIK